MSRYPEITLNPFVPAVSDAARSFFVATFGWMNRFYDVGRMKTDPPSRSFNPPPGERPDNEWDLVRELVAAGWIQEEFYGPACYGHTSHRMTLTAIDHMAG